MICWHLFVVLVTVLFVWFLKPEPQDIPKFLEEQAEERLL